MTFDRHWQALSQRLGLADDTRETVRYWLIECYSEPHRYYHRLSHIEAMLEGFVRLPDWTDHDAVELAIIFHDAIYDPSRSDNEACSADAMRARLSEIDAMTLNRASAMIEATKSHKATGDADADRLLDLDMAILGAPWAAYTAYAEGVRREYEPVYGADAYRAGRLSLFIEPALQADRIFLTPEFASREAQARLNLKREAETLRPA
ncbi:hypothetical protein AEYBE204_16160 [Asticcacaulis sp. YBE204]|nr:hypothetical protein AEYBE204_16160 [Asticcacaulis sp. YBE204]